MIIKSILFVISLAVSIVSFGETYEKDRYLSVSMVSLIANPKSFDSRNVQVFGYLDTPGLKLYMTRDHSEEVDVASSLSIRDPELDNPVALSECLHKYVVVVGRFHALDYRGFVEPDYILSGEEKCWEKQP